MNELVVSLVLFLTVGLLEAELPYLFDSLMTFVASVSALSGYSEAISG